MTALATQWTTQFFVPLGEYRLSATFSYGFFLAGTLNFTTGRIKRFARQ